MKRTTRLFAPFLLMFASCSTVGETGRRQLTLFSDEQMTQMGVQSYAEACKEYKVLKGTPDALMVERIGAKIAKASGRNYAWEFRLLDAPKVVNAFCLPGGKVAVYSGILAVTQNEDALAAVMGHEVAHATCNHGNERVTQGSLSEAALSVGGAFVGMGSLSPAAKESLMTALNAGANLGVLLPFSRAHETEADEVGLLYLVRAGYNPDEAPKLWERMAKLGGDAADPLSKFVGKFTSTHPASEDRAKRLRELTPVMKERVAKERAAAGGK